MKMRPLPPYPLEIPLINRRCHGKINLRQRSYGYTQTERFHDPPIGQPPFIEVQIRSVFRVYYYDVYGLIGFISPSIEFLGEQGTNDLMDSLGDVYPTNEAAEMLQWSPRYLEKLRRQGEGPKFWRIASGTHPYMTWYALTDIEAYAEELKVRPERRGGRRERKQKE